jgi:GxxExxY protein
MFSDLYFSFICVHLRHLRPKKLLYHLTHGEDESMNSQNESAKRDPQTYAIIGACMEVHNELGPGFLEAVYQEALEIELTRREIPFIREMPLVSWFTGVPLKTRYDADFFCYDSVILELKAQSELIPKNEAQTIHYLKATRCERGLLVNFGAPQLEYRRMILTQAKKDLAADGADERR